MIWMKSTDLMRKYINLLRYDTGNPLPFILGLILAILVLSNLTTVFLKESDNYDKCFLAMKDILTVLTMFSCISKRFFNPDDSIRVSRLIEEESFMDRFRIDVREKKWRKIEKHYDEKRKDLESSSQTIIPLMFVAYLGFVVRYLFLEILGASFEDDPRGFPTPLVSFIPPGIDEIPFLIYIFVLQSFLMVFVALEVFSIYVSLLLGVKKIMTDFQTIYILFEEIGNNYPGFAVEDGIDIINVRHAKKMNDKDIKELRKDMRLIVHYHQNHNRTLNDCARISGYGILMASFLIAIDTCFNIYLMLQANNPKIVIYYAASCFCNNILLLLCYYSGQRISNQNEIFRRCLADLPWTNKPRWFKQSMLIMMTRANVDTEINPYGVFVLNLTSYKDLMKAAFSFGNILYRRKSMD